MNFNKEVRKVKGKLFKNINKRKEEHGAVLVIGVLFLTFLLLLAIPFLFQISNERRMSEKSYKAFAALSMAEAGVERAIWELNSGDVYTWSGSSSLRTMNIASFLTSDGETMGSIDIQIEDPEGDTPVVQSTGKVPYIGTLTVDRTARVELWKGNGSSYLFGHGVFGDEGIELDSNAQIDSYDSSNGEYDPNNPGANGDIGTNATHLGCIYLSANARVYGNASTGFESIPEDIIITKPVSTISGEKLALSKPQPMPSIVPPEGLIFRGDYFLDGGNQDIIIESGEYTSFRIQNNSKVTIASDVTLYITGELSMTSNTQLEIADGVNVTIYLGGSFVQESNTQINNLSMDPTKFVFLGTDSFNGDMDWNSNSDFWGSVYVPRANVNYNSEADFYGAVSGKFVDICSQATLHYDEALGDLKIKTGSPGDTFIVKSWHELVPPVGS
ncbi:hypothetical protein AMJ44_06815 [candidate division WOR-1 bacterium DG_54_3]|jgi:hypothetical protein|uniref:DUF7305 domain-containing protein n=1 Tax=candidate division WOR-1 bacterium DG_54_3 TaxID=1703775 RepID=A0A0S7Y0L6_UNCSA|nr:MAG: hypothetical protein AMJ44_06815 [candidate division WOR-1 bacterium DG_54_3]